MSAVQQLLLPDPHPLVERLGRDFFRQLPERPGVYLMRDDAGVALYIGKARNLRQRLGSYRVANPDRLPRRLLRLLRAVSRIECQECPTEAAALAREAELLRTLKPRFNRAGTWPAPPRFLACRGSAQGLELAITSTPVAQPWQSHGPLGAGAPWLRTVLARLLWFANHPKRGYAGMPHGWFRGRPEESVTIPLCSAARVSPVEVMTRIESLFAGEAESCCGWIRAHAPPDTHPFELAALEADLEFIYRKFGRMARLERTSIESNVRAHDECGASRAEYPGRCSEAVV